MLPRTLGSIYTNTDYSKSNIINVRLHKMSESPTRQGNQWRDQINMSTYSIIHYIFQCLSRLYVRSYDMKGPRFIVFQDNWITFILSFLKDNTSTEKYIRQGFNCFWCMYW